jgi:hypothetical protein
VNAVKELLCCQVGFALLLASGASTTFAQSRTGLSRAAPTRITVQVQSYLLVPSKTLSRAEELASDILLQAGVHVSWLDCDATVPLVERRRDCAQPPGPTDFILILADKIQALSPELPESTLGLALVPPDNGHGYVAYISYWQAKKIARKKSIAVDRVLALGAAHELGHLLLGEGAHSSTGIMKVWWNGDEVKPGSGWNMLFTPQQARHMQSNLQLRRVGSQTAD